MMQAITNVIIFDFHSFLADGYIKFDKQITKVGSMKDFDPTDCDTVLDATGCILTPSFVNAHHHSYTVFGRGWHAKSDAQDLLQMLKETWWKLDGMLGSEEVYQSGRYNAGEMIKNGITTVIEHHASGKVIEGSLELLKKAMCDELGMRGIFCFETSDRYPIDACIRENLLFSKENRTDKTVGIFGMNACLSLSEDTLEKVEGIIGDMPIHIHVGESDADNEINIAKYNKTPIERLSEHHLLNKNSILSHCVCVSDKDWEILKEHEVYIAMNVTSNLNNGLNIPDYKKIRKNGMKCLLGCDGHGMNFAKELTNFYYTMKQKYNSEDISLDDVQYIIDSNNEYASKMLGCKLGRVEERYEADFVLCEYNSPTPLLAENVREHYWNAVLEAFHPKDVWCQGKQLLKDYNSVNQTEINIKKLNQLTQKIWNEF
ncbi:MAG: amidohydrolase family protein [Candidatus Metalachnospira sp.]|nr:amidohydrolase family protein [Candidatus Metalachnospira sp.]